MADHGLVFCTRSGTQLDAANIRRQFRDIADAAGLGRGWTPRELRHAFVSLLSASGTPVEEIARLAGHSSTRTTEVIYRRELGCSRPAGHPRWAAGLRRECLEPQRIWQELIQAAGSWKCQITSDGQPPPARAADGR